MSFRQVEQILITNVSCNHVEHQSKAIDTLCLNANCQETCSLCARCLLKSHTQCQGQVCKIELIPDKIMELRQLQLDVVVFQEQINQLFKELLSQLEYILSPISKYQESPNLTNLNLIGSLLRQDPRNQVIQAINETKIQIKQLLDNHNITNEKSKEQVKKDQVSQQSKAQNNQDQEQNVKEWYYKGHQLYEDDQYKEAIDCFDRAIKIDPNHLDSWYLKGQSLYEDDKYKEAIDCFDKAIEIDPNHWHSWYDKGRSLFCDNKYKEAIKCCEDVLKLFPNDSDFLDLLQDGQEEIKKQ